MLKKKLLVTVTIFNSLSFISAYAAIPGNKEDIEEVQIHEAEVTQDSPQSLDSRGLLKQIYSDQYAGYRIPHEEEAAINKTGGHTTYGEITYDSIHKLIQELGITSNDVFMDLGSGVGKMVIQVSLDTPAKECIGVEFSKSRHLMAEKARQELIALGRTKPDQKVEFWNTDMLKADIGRATVVFLNGVAHQEQFNRRIIDKLSEAAHPIRIVSVVPLAQHPRMKEIKRLNLPMSWDEKGVETVIYETIPMN